MFHKLHIKLTLFFTMGTGLILILMTGICLYLSQSSLSRNQYNAFSTSVSSTLSYLEAQNVIPHTWLLEQEHNNHFSIRILDNQNPLFFSKLEEDSSLAALYDQALETAQKDYSISMDFYSEENILAQHVEFQMKAGKKDYYASVALIPREQGSLTVIILSSLDLLESQILSLRLLFLAADLAGLLCLAAFSWYFTKKLLKPLEENRRQQTQFIASASHELRTPLAVIRSCLSALRSCSPGESAHFCEIMEQESQRMTGLIQDMLSLANADNHSWTLHMTSTEMDTLLLNLFEHYEKLAEEREHNLRIQLPDTLCPPCNCDPDRISQVLSIFIDNALSYTPKGSTITLSLEVLPWQVCLSVADNGPGIPNEEKQAVFRRFYRSDQSRHTKGHYGLGLSIAWEIVRLHNGSLKIEDAPGGGAVFLLSLPYTK
ncbi:MAG TPA: HAMP domain-containing histidine kinase [Candidatus Blautia intestinigallinarum]|nr:HAMP domain-containing histidine kinase [Candidatus Blautia intestinigallinarum]